MENMSPQYSRRAALHNTQLDFIFLVFHGLPPLEIILRVIYGLYSFLVIKHSRPLLSRVFGNVFMQNAYFLFFVRAFVSTLKRDVGLKCVPSPTCRTIAQWYNYSASLEYLVFVYLLDI